jgi:hypothetical protein
MAATIDEITITYHEGDTVTVKELEKVVLSKGAWTTIIFKYQDWDKRKEIYGPEKYSIRRYQKKNNEYRQKSKFNISSKDQAEKIIDVLSKWTRDLTD